MVFDSEPIQYGEWAYGYAKEHQTICKLPNLRGLSLSIGQEQSSDGVWQTEQIQLTLDMSEGIFHESYHVETPLGKSFDLEMQSFASMTRSEFYVCRYTIKMQISQSQSLFPIHWTSASQSIKQMILVLRIKSISF